MKSAVIANETAQPLAFTFIPTVQRLPVHIQVINTIRSSPWPEKQQQPSSVMNEPLHITEELPSAGVTMADTVDRGNPRQQLEISQSRSNEGGDVSSQEAGSSEGIFKAELVFLADSCGTNGDHFSRENEAEVNLSAKKLPLSSLSPNRFVDDKNGSIQKELIVNESKASMLQNTEQKVDRSLQEPLFQYKIKSSYKAFAAIPTNTLLLEQKAIDEAISDSEESPAASTFGKTHSQFLHESESLRQQSEELYATIEQLLKDPLPMRSSSSTPKSLQKLQYSEAHKPINPVQKSAGRETKYANLYLSASESMESRPTRPGVIRPITIVQKVPAVSKMKENNHNPFRKHPEEYGDTEPRHSITTIHENEALGINEIIDATTELNKDQHQSHSSQRGLERSVLPNTDYNQEALVISEEK